jgi:hypothetical protein
MTAKSDDLEAVRVLAATLEPFKGDERERIIRWAREKLGMSSTGGSSAPSMPLSEPFTTDAVMKPPPPPRGTDIKEFVAQKDPKSDVHFAATIAYYHQFIAPSDERRDSITKDDIVEACRQVDRKRPRVPAQVLVNAYRDGVFDRGQRGHYELNSVGENLVAMALPGTPEKKVSRKRKKPATGGRGKGRRKARR